MIRKMIITIMMPSTLIMHLGVYFIINFFVTISLSDFAFII